MLRARQRQFNVLRRFAGYFTNIRGALRRIGPASRARRVACNDRATADYSYALPRRTRASRVGGSAQQRVPRRLSIAPRAARPAVEWIGGHDRAAGRSNSFCDRKEVPMQKIVPFLWYAKEAEQAAALYTSIFPDSRIKGVTTMPSESPSGPPGSVAIVEFELFGQDFTAMSAGPLDPFNHAISFVVRCESQAEIDRYWNALLEGGSPEQCGWLRDRFGVSWQIVPTVLDSMIADPNRERAKRAADAMLKMVKIDIAALQKAYDGR
jgi:predicted 3-demethylubiquinone-9 3-methyltransferase (glyoxalase superfamily)